MTRSLLALHATDPATVYLSVAARVKTADHAALERAQYEDGLLVRMLAMRRTMFVVTAEAAPIVQVAACDAVAAQIKRRYGQLLEQAGIATDGAHWLERACEAAVAALRVQGDLTGAELGRAVPVLQTKISLAEGKAYGATVNVTAWVTTQLAAEGRIRRGRPLGSWTGNQYRWHVADPPPSPPRAGAREAARARLVAAWLQAFGPATVADVKWWTGWTLGETRLALAALDTVPVDLDGVAGVALAEDAEPVQDAAPWVALLPALDPTPMGWVGREWYLGEHAPAVFDRSGNVGPTVWADGRIVGGWAQRRSGEVVFRLLDDVGLAAQAEVARLAERMQAVIGGMRVTPRFRTPLERELSA